jgi:hypothetical protein
MNFFGGESASTLGLTRAAAAPSIAAVHPGRLRTPAATEQATVAAANRLAFAMGAVISSALLGLRGVLAHLVDLAAIQVSIGPRGRLHRKQPGGVFRDVRLRLCNVTIRERFAMSAAKEPIS